MSGQGGRKFGPKKKIVQQPPHKSSFLKVSANRPHIFTGSSDQIGWWVRHHALRVLRCHSGVLVIKVTLHRTCLYTHIHALAPVAPHWLLWLKADSEKAFVTPKVLRVTRLLACGSQQLSKVVVHTTGSWLPRALRKSEIPILSLAPAIPSLLTPLTSDFYMFWFLSRRFHTYTPLCYFFLFLSNTNSELSLYTTSSRKPPLPPTGVRVKAPA